MTNEIKRLNLVVDEKISAGYRSQSELAELGTRVSQLGLENEQLKRKANELRELNVRLE